MRTRVVFKPANTPTAPATAPTTAFLCHWCEREFVSAARLERHLKHNRVLNHADLEAAVRAQLEAEDAARVADRRPEPREAES